MCYDVLYDTILYSTMIYYTIRVREPRPRRRAADHTSCAGRRIIRIIVMITCIRTCISRIELLLYIYIYIEREIYHWVTRIVVTSISRIAMTTCLVISMCVIIIIIIIIIVCSYTYVYIYIYIYILIRSLVPMRWVGSLIRKDLRSRDLEARVRAR